MRKVNEKLFLTEEELLEQIDLFLASHDIRVSWYGMAKIKEIQVGGMDYVIRLAFAKSDPKDFCNDVLQFKRKSAEEIWQGDFDSDVIKGVRLAPSACNTQPWRIFSERNRIKVYRNTKKKSFIPASSLPMS